MQPQCNTCSCREGSCINWGCARGRCRVIAGSDKNAGVPISNEAGYGALAKLGSKAIDNMIPGSTPNVSKQLKEGLKQAAGLLEAGVKKQTDKVVDKTKDKQ